MKKIYLLLLNISLLSLTLEHSATTILSGQSDAAQEETFSTSVKEIKKADTSGAIYSSKRDDGAQNFSIDRLFEGQTLFAPVISEKALLKEGLENKSIENPLFNKAIQAFGLFELEVNLFSKKEALLVSTAQEPDRIYFTEPVNALDPNAVAQLERTSSLRDASGQPGAKVQKLSTDKVGAVFAAVAPAAGNFGDANSGIAIAARTITTIINEQEEIKKIIFDQMMNAFRLDGTEGLTNIGADAIIREPIDMHWDPILQRLFIALQVTSGANGMARALVVGKMDANRKFTLEKFIPDAAVADNNQIIATGTAHNSVSISKVRTMHTSTGLSYAIVVGNNGDPENTQSDIFALPLVSSGEMTGMLAAKTADPVTEFFTLQPLRFKSRDFTQAATTADEVIRNDGDDEIIAHIGQETLLAGVITDLMVLNDTIFATIGVPAENGLAGVYSSRALFSANGKIKGWTKWQRATGSTDQIFNITYDKTDGSTLLFSGANNTEVKTVKKTTWASNNKITSAVTQLLSNEDGNAQQLLSFAQQPGAQNISLLVAIDTNSIALINTGFAENNDLLMPTNQNAIVVFEDGVISQNIQEADDIFAIGIAGDILANAGPLTACTIAQNTNLDQTFIFIGGLNGIVVFADENGAGIAGHIQPGFVGITAGMQMQQFGNFSSVRKLCADENFLYILTDDQLMRINLNDNIAITDPFVSTVLTTRKSLGVNIAHGSLLDMIVSDHLAFITTTNGLFVNGPTTNIQMITNTQEALWEKIDLPEGIGAPITLQTATQTNNDHDLARGAGGNLFVLSNDQGNNRSRLHRIAIDMQNGELHPLVFDDVLVQNKQTFFLNFGQSKNIFFSDGARYFIGQNKHITDPVALGLLNQKYPPRIGIANVGNQTISITEPVNGATKISAFVNDHAAGSYVIASDHGISIHE